MSSSISTFVYETGPDTYDEISVPQNPSPEEWADIAEKMREKRVAAKARRENRDPRAALKADARGRAARRAKTIRRLLLLQQEGTVMKNGRVFLHHVYATGPGTTDEILVPLDPPSTMDEWRDTMEEMREAVLAAKAVREGRDPRAAILTPEAKEITGRAARERREKARYGALTGRTTTTAPTAQRSARDAELMRQVRELNEEVQ